MSAPTPPSEPIIPKGVLTYEQIRQLLEADKAAKQKVRDELEGAVANARGWFVDGLLDGIADLFRGIVRPGFESAAQAFEDGQLVLKNRLDLYSALEEQGTAFMSVSDPVLNTGRVDFSEKLSGSKGVRFEDGGIVMLDRGRWDIDAMITADWVLLTGTPGVDYTRVTWEIHVLAPDGSLYHRKTGVFDGQGPMTGQLFTRVVVPEPGYRAEVHVNAIAPFRGLLRGPQWSHLTVDHINQSTAGGATGTEPSDVPKG